MIQGVSIVVREKAYQKLKKDKQQAPGLGNLTRFKNCSVLIVLCLLFSVSAVNGQSYNLEECVRIALQNKEAVKIAALGVKSAKAQKKGALRNVLPSFRLSGGWNEARFPDREFTIDPSTGEPVVGSGGATISSLTTWSSGINGSQTIYDGGGWWNRIAQAKNNYLITQQRERQARINVVLEVHQTFFQLLKSQQLFEVARLSLNLADQQVELVRRQFELGVVKKTDLLKAEVRYGQAKVELVNRKSSIRNALFALRNAMGLINKNVRFTVKDIERQLRPVPEREETYKLMTENNPVLLASQAQVTDAKISYKLSRAIRLPTLYANISYSASSDELSRFTTELNESWRLNSNISLSLPLFTGFDASSRVQQAKLAARSQQNEYTTLRNDLIVQLEKIMELLQNYRQIIPINEEILLSAEEDLKLAQERYSLGSVTILEVLDAQVSLTQAKSNLISSRYDARIQEANIKALLGTLDKGLSRKDR